jgi:hypothetical protein
MTQGNLLKTRLNISTYISAFGELFERLALLRKKHALLRKKHAPKGE